MSEITLCNCINYLIDNNYAELDFLNFSLFCFLFIFAKAIFLLERVHIIIRIFHAEEKLYLVHLRKARSLANANDFFAISVAPAPKLTPTLLRQRACGSRFQLELLVCLLNLPIKIAEIRVKFLKSKAICYFID